MNLQPWPIVIQSRRTIGIAGETTARFMFQRAGYKVSPAEPSQGDLQIMHPTSGEICSIEVKTARRSKDKKWRFPLIPGGNASTSHLKADKVLLLAVLNSGRVIPFLIPVDELRNQKQVCITSYPLTYAGKFRKYRLEEELRI